MICTKCGTSLPDTAKFCRMCGQSVNDQKQDDVTGIADTVLLPKNTSQQKPSETETVLLPKNTPQRKSSEAETVLLPRNTLWQKQSEAETVLLPENIPQQKRTTDEMTPKRSAAPAINAPAKKKPKTAAIFFIAAAVILIVVGAFVAKKLFKRSGMQLEQAQVYLTEEQYDLAANEYEKMIISYPTDERGYLGKAEVYAMQGMTEEAIKVLETGFRKTNSEKIWEMLSKLKSQQYGTD